MANGSEADRSVSDDDSAPEPGGGRARALARSAHEPPAGPFVWSRPESPAGRGGHGVDPAPSVDEEADEEVAASDPSNDASDDGFEPL